MTKLAGMVEFCFLGCLMMWDPSGAGLVTLYAGEMEVVVIVLYVGEEYSCGI
jgi:hypothetical protein